VFVTRAAATVAVSVLSCQVRAVISGPCRVHSEIVTPREAAKKQPLIAIDRYA